jgi:hypothetical protein
MMRGSVKYLYRSVRRHIPAGLIRNILRYQLGKRDIHNNPVRQYKVAFDTNDIFFSLNLAWFFGFLRVVFSLPARLFTLMT